MQYTKYYKSLMAAVGRLKTQTEAEEDDSPLGTILSGTPNLPTNLMQLDMHKMNRFSRIRSLSPKPHILVCAQSNGAVDEILGRIKLKGMLSNDLTPYNPDIVRVGPSNATNQQVKEVSLDSIVAHCIF
jgi:hypothetical protein